MKNYDEVLESAYLPSYRTALINRQFNAIDPEVRKAMLKCMRRSEILHRLVGDVEYELRQVASGDLADAFLGEIVLQDRYYYLR